VVVLCIYVNTTPVFAVVVKSPPDFRLLSKRQEADLQLRQCFLDVQSHMKIPVWHGISASGIKIALRPQRVVVV
ncbi:hypothetical protein BJ322DRAFT_1007059, partial [Thelephora terrestris]